MAVDFSNPYQSIIYLIKIETQSGTVLRYSNFDVYVSENGSSTFSFYEGRLESISSIKQGFNDLRDSFSTTSSVAFSLINAPRAGLETFLDDTLTSLYLPNSKVSIFLIQKEDLVGPSALTMGPSLRMGPGLFMGARSGSTPYTSQEYQVSDADLIFKGALGNPDAYTEYTEESITFQAYDETFNDQILSAPGALEIGQSNNIDQFPDVRPEDTGKALPYPVGDFRDFWGIPAYLIQRTGAQNIDSLKGELLTFKTAETQKLLNGQAPFKSLDEVLGVGVGIGVASTTRSNTDATIEVDRLDVLDLDQTHAGGEGLTRGVEIADVFGGNSTDLLEHPVEVIYWMLRNLLDVSQDNIRISSFTNLQSEDTSLQCRKALYATKSVVEEIVSLSFEFGFYLHNTNAEFVLTKTPETTDVNSVLTVEEKDVLTGSYRVRLDPNRVLFNRVRANLLTNEFLNQSYGAIKRDFFEKQTINGKPRDFSYVYTWAYRRVDTLNHIGILSLYFINPIQEISVSCASTAFDVEPNQVIELTYHRWTSQKCVVRSVQKDLEKLTVNLTLWPIVERKRKNYQSSPSDLTDYSSPATDTGYFHGALEIVKDHNDTIKVTTDSDYTATLSSGFYATAEALAEEIQREINALSTTRTVTVSYNASTRKFTITSDDASNFQINWTDTPDIGRDCLGFDVSADDTGAASYTSDFCAVFDTTDDERLTEYA